MTPRAVQTADLQQMLNQMDDLQSEVVRLRHALEHQERLATLGTLAGLIAHEFNNILTPVISYAQLAQSNPEDRELMTKAIGKCLHGSERASQIAAAILGFVRDDSPDLRTRGRIELQAGSDGGSTWNGVERRGGRGGCDVAAALKEALSCLAREPERDGVTLIVEIEPGCRAAMKPVALQHVLLNVILNARNAMIPGGGRLTIRGRVLSERPGVVEDAVSSASEREPGTSSDAGSDYDWVVLEIEDTGRGMSRERLERVFEAFYTARESGSGEGGGGGAGVGAGVSGGSATAAEPAARGTGLGMTICQRLVGEAGGWLTVSSREGKGTRVQVCLPRAG